MATQNELSTKPVSIPQLQVALVEIVESLPPPKQNQSLIVTVTPSVQVMSLHFKLPQDKRGEWAAILAEHFSPLQEFQFLDISSWKIIHPSFHINYQCEDGVTARIFILKPDGTQLSESERPATAETLRALNKTLPLGARQKIVSDSLPEIHRDQLKYQQSILSELNSTTSKITTEVAKFSIAAQRGLEEKQAQIDNKFRQRQEELDLAYRQREADLDAAFRKRQTETDQSHRQKESELDAAMKLKDSELSERVYAREQAVGRREEEVRKQKEELDLRTSTAARRANQKQIQQIIDSQSTVQLTGSTARKRISIHALCALGILTFGSIAAVFLWKISNTTNDHIHWQFAIPFSTGLLGFASTLVYWIKWSDNWFREHARAEFANRKLNADATRAAWLVELLLEWSKEGRDAMPTTVIESLTKNLFTDVSSEVPSHASDPLQKFLTRLANIRVTADGVELDSKAKASTRV